jgi:pimeloyl-ACP methyl ester carboxylesterase
MAREKWLTRWGSPDTTLAHLKTGKKLTSSRSVQPGVTQDCFVTSKDGTEIHLCVAGSGPGVILVHGGLQTSTSLSQLAKRLSDSFTVYRVDRRGRRPSGPFGDSYGLQTEIDDLSTAL